jgi:biotin transport system substrate-specific component
MNMSLALRSRAPVVVLQVVGLSLVIAAGARINVPFWPVPMTLQTCAVLAIAGIFGARMAVASVLAYLLEGAVAMLAATVLIYALGAAWLSRFVGLDQAYALGVAPFLLGDTAKAVLAWALCGLFARKQA